MINQLEKNKCGYFECKKHDFSDIVAHAKDSHVDNPISLGKRKLDSVNQFKRITVVYINPSQCFTIWFCLMGFWEAVNGCYFVTSNVFEQPCILLKTTFWSFMHLFQYLVFDNSLLFKSQTSSTCHETVTKLV